MLIFSGAYQAASCLFDIVANRIQRLQIAMRQHDIAGMQKVLDEDHTQRFKKAYEYILDIAIGNAYAEGVQLLLAYGVDPNGQPFLHNALQTCSAAYAAAYAIYHEKENSPCEQTCMPIVIALLAAGANPNIQAYFNLFDKPITLTMTPLHVATQGGFLAMTKILLLANADPHIKDTHGQSSLLSTLKKLQENMSKNDQERSDFHDAIIAKQHEIIKMLLAAGADPNIEDEDILVRLGIDHTLYKPNLTYKIRQVAYQRYIHGDSSMLRTMLGLHRQAMLGTTSEKEGACDYIAAQNRDFFKDIVDRSLAEEIRFYMDCDEADSSIKESEAISRKELYLYFDQDKARLSIEQNESTLRAELTKKMLP